MQKVKLKVKKLDYESAESYRALRTNLQFCGEDKKTIVVTSCTPDEGKSTAVLHLAIALSEYGKRVLLIDADLRKSVMIGNFAVSKELKGFTHYLSGQIEAEEVICSTDSENLDVIFAGPFPPNPTELLGSERFKKILKTKRDEYDYILIDSAPLGNVIDSAVIAGECDGAIIVIEAECISYRFAQEIKEQLDKSGCPVLGAILNKVDTRFQKYYSYYYRKRYGKYYKSYGKRYGKYYEYEKKGK